MRIIFLTILFFVPLYFFTQEEEDVTATIDELSPVDDQIKLKQGAPERLDRILTVEKPLPSPELGVQSDESSEASFEEEDTEEDSSEDETNSGEEVQLTDLEESWNTELKQTLSRLEPAEADEIFKNYSKAQEGYQSELEALMNEKQQKTTKEAALEVDQLISQLESKHQDQLKEVLGAHYEAVRDQYQQHMDSADQE
jgi:hypothetical protein